MCVLTRDNFVSTQEKVVEKKTLTQITSELVQDVRESADKLTLGEGVFLGCVNFALTASFGPLGIGLAGIFDMFYLDYSSKKKARFDKKLADIYMELDKDGVLTKSVLRNLNKNS